jgi:hypothetical protein
MPNPECECYQGFDYYHRCHLHQAAYELYVHLKGTNDLLMEIIQSVEAATFKQRIIDWHMDNKHALQEAELPNA